MYLVNISYSQYQRKGEDDIRRISKTDTRSLWKNFNRYFGRGSKDPEVDLNTFSNIQRKKLNANDDSNAYDDNIANEHIELNEECEAILNSKIT